MVGCSLRNLHQLRIFTHGGVVVVNVDRILALLRIVSIAILVAPFVIVRNKLVEAHTPLQEVVSHKLVDGVLLVGQVALCFCAIGSFYLSTDSSYNLVSVRDGSSSAHNRCRNTPLFCKDIVGFNETSEAKVAVLCFIETTCYTVEAARLGFVLLSFILMIEGFDQLLVPTCSSKQSSHDIHVASFGNKVRHSLAGRSDDSIYFVQETIAGLVVCADNTRATIELIVSVDGSLRAIRELLQGYRTVVQIAFGESTVYIVTKIGTIVSCFRAIVNDTTVGNTLSLFQRKIVNRLSFPQEVGDILRHSFVGGRKDGVVTTRCQH